jgi:hypothetical protein
MPSEREQAPDQGALAWAFGRPAVPAMQILGLFGLLIVLVGLTTGTFSIQFSGVGTAGFWVVVFGLLLVFVAAVVRVAIRSRGRRVVAYRGGEEIQTEEFRPGPWSRRARVPTSRERTTRR